MTPAPTVTHRMVLRTHRTRSPARRRAANPLFRPLQNTVQTGTERRGHLARSGRWGLHSSAMRRRPLRISRTRSLVEMGNSRRREGFVERRSCWTQNQTWPPRLPKMVPITMDLEGRGGAMVAAALEEVEEEVVEDEGEVAVVVVGGRWRREEVLKRFLVEVAEEKGVLGVAGVLVVVEVVVFAVDDGKKQGRKNRRRKSMVMVGGAMRFLEGRV
ncbi:uncharacterized protein DS421_4g123040 [Arachis hypogaea]|nr:uncharacterized protein DS421_4g123040 [Arachis hypogaea]